MSSPGGKPRVSPDYQRSLVGLADIPIERDTIGAMRVSGNVDTFKPYTYRGTGEDTLAFYFDGVKEPRPKQEPAKEASRKAEQERAKRREAAKSERIKEQHRQQLLREQIARDLDRELRESLRQASIEADAQLLDAPTPKADTRRPSPGWRPPTGGDLEQWL